VSGKGRTLLSGHRPVERNGGGRQVGFKAKIPPAWLRVIPPPLRTLSRPSDRDGPPRRYTAWLSQPPTPLRRWRRARVPDPSRTGIGPQLIGRSPVTVKVRGPVVCRVERLGRAGRVAHLDPTGEGAVAVAVGLADAGAGGERDGVAVLGGGELVVGDRGVRLRIDPGPVDGARAGDGGVVAGRVDLALVDDTEGRLERPGTALVALSRTARRVAKAGATGLEPATSGVTGRGSGRTVENG